jgi:hypothetical protein
MKMMKTLIRSALAAVIAAAGLGAAQAQDDESNRCVTLRNVNGYSVIDDRHLILNAGANDHFLVTTRSRCSGLRFGAQIGTSFGDNARLCPPYGEYIIPDDGWRCLIDRVEEVESEEAGRELVRQRNEAEESEG